LEDKLTFHGQNRGHFRTPIFLGALAFAFATAPDAGPLTDPWRPSRLQPVNDAAGRDEVISSSTVRPKESAAQAMLPLADVQRGFAAIHDDGEDIAAYVQGGVKEAKTAKHRERQARP
jgi:hypothetical protein